MLRLPPSVINSHTLAIARASCHQVCYRLDFPSLLANQLRVAGLPVSPEALEAGNDWFCSQVTHHERVFWHSSFCSHRRRDCSEALMFQQQMVTALLILERCAGLQQGQPGPGSSYKPGQNAFPWKHSL